MYNLIKKIEALERRVLSNSEKLDTLTKSFEIFTQNCLQNTDSKDLGQMSIQEKQRDVIKEKVLKLSLEIDEAGLPSDYFLVQTKEFIQDYLDYPYIEYAVYHAVNVYRDHEYLKFVVNKLQDYTPFTFAATDVSRITSETANSIMNACDTSNLKSIVDTVCKFSSEQLNIIGY